MSTEYRGLSPEVKTLVDELLQEQRELSAVGKFSQSALAKGPWTPGTRHRDLIPLTAPRPGEQYGFEVDLDRCSGCKGCVTACHALNGLDEGESWREVGVLLGEIQEPVSRRPEDGNRVVPWQQTVTSACHHCVEPACLLGCPVLAYDKDPVTGIVRHLDDQCIGCSYCIMKCPYEVPRFSAKRGIVRKCDMCQGRLADSEAPACVQACPNEAIRITLVPREWVAITWRKREAATWLPDAPAPDYTLPTTRYITRKASPQLAAADHYRNRPAHSHWPLMLMLTFTQFGMGAMWAGWFRTGPVLNDWNLGRANAAALMGALLYIAGLGASVFHLGQPLKAWRIWLGWRTSWMSREAMALNALLGLAAATALVATVPGTRLALGREPWAGWIVGWFPMMRWGLTGLIGVSVFTQAMVYIDTRRHFWSAAQTLPRFLGTVALGAVWAASWIEPAPMNLVALAVIVLLKLAMEARVLKHADTDSRRRDQRQRTAALIVGPLRLLWAFRLLATAVGAGTLAFGRGAGLSPAVGSALVTGLFLAGELAERALFFAAVSPDKMPGLP